MTQSGGSGADFHLPAEIPTDPYEQLELARKITSLAIASSVSKLKSEAGRLRQQASEKDRVIADLRDKLSSLDHRFHEVDDRLRDSLEENIKLSKERDSLTLTLKKLDGGLAKSEIFKMRLMQLLTDDNPSISVANYTVEKQAETVDLEPCDQSIVASSCKDDSSISGSLSNIASGVEKGSAIQDASRPALSPTRVYSIAGSPKMASDATSPTNPRIDGNTAISPQSPSSQQSSKANSPPRGRPLPGATSTEPEVIKEDADMEQKSSFKPIIFKKILSPAAAKWCCIEISFKELEYVVLSSEGHKAPGPEGFNADFFKKNWSVVKTEIWDAVNNFFRASKLAKLIDHTFMALIPKEVNSSELNSFCPVALFNCINKFIAQILVNRSQEMLRGLISPNQAAFIRGRRVSDNILLAHEILRGFQSKRSPGRACIKLDLTKAYESVNRDFILHALRCFEFPPKWVEWIRGCICTPPTINGGSPDGFISSSNRGLRQDCPLSPLLFSFVMEVLSSELERGLMLMKWKSYRVGSAPVISHLVFADHVLIFSKPSVSSLRYLAMLVQNFGIDSGLKFNTGKSSIFFSRSVSDGHSLAQVGEGLTIVGNLPVRYLGLPPSSSSSSKKVFVFQPLVDYKLRCMAKRWAARSLSFDGDRVELKSRSELQNYLYYWCLAFSITSKVQMVLEKIVGDLLWG